MDLQLTNVEHFSESDIEDKMRQLNVRRSLRERSSASFSCSPTIVTWDCSPQAFQQEITLNTNKIDALIVFGENLIQKSAPLDAALIEDELEELHSYCQEVFGRVARFHHRLVTRRPVSGNKEEEEKARWSKFTESFYVCRFWRRRSGTCRTTTQTWTTPPTSQTGLPGRR